MKVFGLNHLSKKVVELLFKEVKFKNEPEKWSWTPHNPEKIKNVVEIVAKEKEAVKYACLTNYEPTNKKQKVVLVFAYGNLSYGLIENFKKEGLKFFFIDFLQFTLLGKVIIKLENGTQKKELQIEGLTLKIEDIGCILWNPPPLKYFYPIFDSSSIHPKKGRNFFLFKKRWLQLLRDLIHLVPQDAVWLPGNTLTGSQDWQNKIGEYSIAESIGLNIPPTIFTNDLNELKNFGFKYGPSIVLREFSSPPWSFPPIRIDLNKISYKNFEKSPSCFQQYIEKQHEYRVIVLFDKVFPCRIYSQDSILAKDDWRVHDDANVKWEMAELPNDLKEQLLIMSKMLNLTWCSIDLIYGKDKKYYYLEANRPGAHYWLDPFVGFDISKAIVFELKSRKLAESL